MRSFADFSELKNNNYARVRFQMTYGMQKKFCLLKWVLMLSFAAMCTSGCNTDVGVSTNAEKVVRHTVEESRKPVAESFPWSSSLLWQGLLLSRSHATFSTRINDKIPEMTFTINGNFDGEEFIPSNIEIRDAASGKIVQTLNAKGRFDNHGHGFAEINLFFADLVQFIDLNDDGYLDLRLLFEAGATGNNWYATYIYQPLKKRFKYREDLSILSGLTKNPGSNIIKTYWRGGFCWECTEFFRMDSNGRLKLDKIEWSEWHSDDNDEEMGCIKYTGIPKDRNAVYLGYSFYHMHQSDFGKYVRRNAKIISNEELRGSLDGRPRSAMGTPMR